MNKKWISLSLIMISTISMAQSLERGIELYNEGNLKEARTFFSSFDSSDEASYYLGRIEFESGNFEKAIEQFEKAIEMNDQVTDYYSKLGNSLGGYAGQSNIFKRGILAPQIKTAYEKAVSLDETNIDAHWGLIEFHTMVPGLFGGSWEKAESAAHSIKKIDVIEGHEALAKVYTRKGEHERAEMEYVAAAKLDTTRLVSLGIYYQSREKYDKAFKTLEAILNKDSNNLNALYQIGRTSALSGTQSEKGIKSLETYLNIEWMPGRPSYAGALMRLGMIYEKKGAEAIAIDYYQRSLKQDPDMEEAKKGLSRLK